MNRFASSLFTMVALCAGVAIDSLIAPAKLAAQQIFYPSTRDPNGVMVMGQGVASVPADVAEIRFAVSNVDLDSPNAYLPPQTVRSGGRPPSGAAETPVQLTEANLKPIVAAIVATGISPNAIQTSIGAAKPDRFGSRLPKRAMSGTIRVTVEKPSQSSVQKVVDAGEKAVKGANLFVQEYVKYRLNDCTALEKTAYTAAIDEAQRHAQAIAAATNVQLAEHPSIAEAFYATFYPSPCSQSSVVFSPMVGSSPYNEGFVLYGPDVEAKVEIRKDLFVTYKLK